MTAYGCVLPEHGYGIRAKQVELAEHILHAIGSRTVSLSEAEVGTGKTHAYLNSYEVINKGTNGKLVISENW